MSIASEFWKSTITLIEEKIQKYIPYRAEVTHSEGGLVRIRTYDADSGMMETFPQLHGQSLSAGDEVAVIELGGKPFVLGRIKKNLSGTNALNTFDGAIHIDSSASNALMVTNRQTSEEVFRVNGSTYDAILSGRLNTDGLTIKPKNNSANTLNLLDRNGNEIFRVNTVLGDAIIKNKFNAGDIHVKPSSNSDNTLAIFDSSGNDVVRVNTAVGSLFVRNGAVIDGASANASTLTPPRFFQASSTNSGVTSTTNTSTFQSAINRSYNLGAGTWTVYLLGGQMLRHSANGGSAYRVRIGSSASAGIVTGFYSTAYTQGIDSHVVTGQTGSIDLAVEYRSSAAGTTTSKAPWLLMLAVRTS